MPAEIAMFDVGYFPPNTRPVEDSRYTPNTGYLVAARRTSLWAKSNQSATQQNRLFDHLVGNREDAGRQRNPQRPRCLQIDYKLELD